MEHIRSDGRRRPHVVCLGAATFDTIFRMDALPSGPGKVLPTEVVQIAHGMASSAAAAIVKLGGASTLFARVGDDAVGDTIIRDLSESGVDCSFIRRCEGIRSPICTVLVDAVGERIVVPYYDPRLERDPDWLPLDYIAAADAALVDVRWPEGAAVVLRTARDASVPAVLDADVGPREVIFGLARVASHAVFSEPAATIATGESEPTRALKTLAKELDGFVAVTAGADGCFWFDRASGTIRGSRPPAVVAVDTLAAGDVFHGAFTLALAESRSIEAAIAFANVAAALKCRNFGGRLGAPARAEVDALLAETGGRHGPCRGN